MRAKMRSRTLPFISEDKIPFFRQTLAKGTTTYVQFSRHNFALKPEHASGNDKGTLCTEVGILRNEQIMSPLFLFISPKNIE